MFSISAVYPRVWKKKKNIWILPYMYPKLHTDPKFKYVIVRRLIYSLKLFGQVKLKLKQKFSLSDYLLQKVKAIKV
jgi:hypothetical protein